MPEKRGPPGKHWAQKARVWAWYFEIKKRCEWSDYRLNFEFAWTAEGLASRASDQRPRTFEWIRKSARIPRATGGGRWRNLPELVAAMDEHELFKGTRIIYESIFWDLIQDPLPKAKYLGECLEQILKENHLERVNPIGFTDIDINGVPTNYERCLIQSISHPPMDLLSGMALIWILYLINDKVHNASIRQLLENLADRKLASLFRVYFPQNIQLQLTYYDKSVKMLLQAKAQEVEDCASLFRSSMCLILPMTS